MRFKADIVETNNGPFKQAANGALREPVSWADRIAPRRQGSRTKLRSLT
jgi:hypothetical protein